MGYVRLHGRNQKAWFADSLLSYERYHYLCTPNELQPWVERIEALREEAEDTYVATNNHYQGKAVANAFELLTALGRAPRALPDGLLAVYPRLLRGLMADGEGVRGTGVRDA